MIKSKYLGIITAVLLFLALSAAIFLVGYTNNKTQETTNQPQYTTELFGNDIISLEIIADQSAWDSMLENATEENYIMVDVIVNGTKFQNVGIRPKGNSSLRQVASDNTSNRYSFRLKFDEYIKNQTCFGLDTFVVNNMIADSTYMKEYISYDLMNFIGVDTPLFGYTNITINGKNWGLYLAVESYDDSFLARTYGDSSGKLYNVKTMDIADNALDGGGMQAPPKQIITNQEQQSTNTTPVKDVLVGGMTAMGGRGTAGGDLQYSGDSSSSYSAIFSNAIGKTTDADEQKVITALKNLSEGKDLESYFAVDKILRYFAAHTVVVNLDSYSSSMSQNYYIYERVGKLTILPWDYNLAFGGFQSGNASSVVNFPIDTPVSGIELTERPLLAKLLENDEYLAKYHQYLNEIMQEYFVSGKYASLIKEIDSKIRTYVEKDATAFFTYEEYQASLPVLTKLGALRAESIMGQLAGTIPATTKGQATSPSALINADSITLSALGSQTGGGRGDNTSQAGIAGRGDFGGNAPPLGGVTDTSNMPDRAIMEQAIPIVQSTNGEITAEVKSQLTQLGISDEQIVAIKNIINRATSEGAMTLDVGNNGTNVQQQVNSVTPNRENILTFIVLGLLLTIAIIFTARYRRKY